MAKYEVGWIRYPNDPEWFDSESQVKAACSIKGKVKYVRRISDNSFVSPSQFNCLAGGGTKRRGGGGGKRRGKRGRRAPLAGHVSSAFGISRRKSGAGYCRICKGPHVYKHGKTGKSAKKSPRRRMWEE